MEFEEITIENFGTIEHVKLKLNTPGMILITGINKDADSGYESNGAGKSLLFDAICWCLWGTTARGLAGDEVVRRKYGKDCCVKLKIKDGKTSYVVARHRKDSRIDKPNDLRLFINGVEKSKKMKGLQETIDQIVGFDFDTFCAMMPGAGVNVAMLTDTKIKELLEKLLQTEQLTSAYKNARERLGILEIELATSNVALLTHMSSLAALEKEVKQLRTLEQSFETNKAANKKICIDRINTLQTEKLQCSVEADKREQLHTAITAFRAEIVALEQQKLLIETPAKAQIALLQSESATLQEHHSVQDQLHKQCVEHLDRLDNLTGVCPTCDTLITKEHVNAAALLIHTDLTQHLNQCYETTARIKLLRQRRTNLISATAADLTIAQGHIDMKLSAIEALKHGLEIADSQAKLMIRIERDIEREATVLAKLEAEQHNFAEIFQTKAEKAFELASDVSKAKTQTKTLDAELKLCKFWVEGFSPAGLRSYMLDYVTPVLNDRAAYYAQVLTGDEMKVTFTTKTALKTGDVKDKFQIQVEQKHGGDLYKASSKGEKARADLVIAMALGDLATFRTTKQLPWRFLDEPFESIDDAGNESVMNLLNDQKTRFKTVFVVTHKPAFKKLFNQRIVIVKENEISRLVQDSNT